MALKGTNILSCFLVGRRSIKLLPPVIGSSDCHGFWRCLCIFLYVRLCVPMNYKVVWLLKSEELFSMMILLLVIYLVCWPWDVYHPSQQNDLQDVLLQLFRLTLFSSHRQLVTVWDPLEHESSPRVTILRIQINLGAEGKVDWMWASVNWSKCNRWSKHHLSVTPRLQIKIKHSWSWIVSIQPLSSKLVYVVSWFLISWFQFGQVAVSLFLCLCRNTHGVF